MTKTYKDQVIVVTGGAGFIGSQIIRALNERGFCNILVVDDLGEDGRWKNLIQLKFIEIIPTAALLELMKGRPHEIQSIIHMGAITDTTFTDLQALMEKNYRYTLDLIEFAVKHEIAFLYASSCSIYGDGAFGFDDDPEKMGCYKPLNPYAFSKYLVDQYVINEKLLDHVVGLRFSNVYGPGEAHKGKMASIVYQMYHQIRQNGKARLFASNHPDIANGEQIRDFVYVKDVADLVVDLMRIDLNGIYNIGASKSRSFNEVAKALFKSMGMPPKIEYIAMPAELEKQYQSITYASTERLNKKIEELGFPLRTMRSIEEGICDYVHHLEGRLLIC